MTTIDVRVAAGAAWLDANRPGWWQRIDLDTLDLGDDCGCILGQENGDFAEGLDAVGLYGDGWARRCADLGLFPATDIRACGPAESEDWVHRADLVADEYRRLTAAWRALIQARREAPAVGPDRTHDGQRTRAVDTADVAGEVL